MLQYFSGYFDTKPGPKVETECYQKIAEEVKLREEVECIDVLHDLQVQLLWVKQTLVIILL